MKMLAFLLGVLEALSYAPQKLEKVIPHNTNTLEVLKLTSQVKQIESVPTQAKKRIGLLARL